MALTLTSEQQLLKDNATQFVREHAPVGHLRRLRDTKDSVGFSRDLWQQMVELGWAGIVIPEAYGGLGLGWTELGLVIEACGRTLAPQPLLSSVALGSALVLAGGSDAQKSSVLPAISSGRALCAVAFEEAPRFRPYHVACKAERVGQSYRLSGHKTFVLDGHVAQHLIVSARTSGAIDDRNGISLFLLDAQQAGVKLERTQMLDSRNAARCTLEAAEVPASALLGSVDKGADLLDPVLDRAAVLVSAELLGLISQAYETTLEYLKTRVQFDALIGSFQALQHRAVNLFCEIELCKSLVREALAAQDAQREDAPLLASAVKAKLSDAATLISREAVQLHGGIGMTDEHDIGLYLKRAAVAEATFGDAPYHRARFASLKGF
ncbi:MAG TPA: acyl-CoA dehydrogenase family protein [Polyangiales bacterium]|nr:acyl-CoA dehydrogenase family protein [Polyangiales bacterium]